MVEYENPDGLVFSLIFERIVSNRLSRMSWLLVSGLANSRAHRQAIALICSLWTRASLEIISQLVSQSVENHMSNQTINQSKYLTCAQN